MELPALPNDFSSFVSYLNQCSTQSDILRAVQPFKDYESTLRRIYAQQPKDARVQREHVVPVFANEQLIIKARDLEVETDADKEKYILALRDSQRLDHGSPATVVNLKEFKTNFNLFSEQSLVDLDWSNVVAAGSSVVAPLLPVRAPHNESKRALRSYYHEQLAPASDVDLFIYGLNEEQAIEKIKQIESSIRDSILAETTTIRTKNAITIVSEYPTRHVQIVLRLYKNITEILTGFDVDCSCVAYDGKQVWASPRALAAFATQQNSIDLTRRSPSYENRLSKYARRGFEVYWPLINRKRVDPTIYERVFNRVVGLARLLVLEKLPHPSDRDTYLDKRRNERGRPELPWNARYRHALQGNVKDAQPDDVPDWLGEEDVSDYHTFTIPYGPRYTAKRIEKLLFKQDLLLNAEWNKPDDRETDLHRHPAFFGTADDVVQDCCGFCPEPKTDEDLKYYEEESKCYISGELKFMKDDPGRQAIGSFNPLTDDDWTYMSYLGSSIKLCQAIADNNLEAVRDWFAEEGADVNRRDHAGRTPLQLACMISTPEIVHELIDHGARIVSRIYNGMTALHMAAHRGNAEIVKLLMDKSEANEAEEDRKEEARKAARRAAFTKSGDEVEMSQAEDGGQDDDDIEMVDQNDEKDDITMKSEGSLVKIEEKEREVDDESDPDFYDIDVLAWDSPLSALHLAIIGGHFDVIGLLIKQYGADVMLPVKLKDEYEQAKSILNLILPLQLPTKAAHEAVRTLLSNGANPAQANADQCSVVHFLVSEVKLQILDLVAETHGDTVKKVINHLVIGGWQLNPNVCSPLTTAINSSSPELVRKVLQLGAKATVDFEEFAAAFRRKFEHARMDSNDIKRTFFANVEQPIVQAAGVDQLADVILEMLQNGADINTLNLDAQRLFNNRDTYNVSQPESLVQVVRRNVRKLSEFNGGGAAKPPQKPDPLPEFDAVRDGSYKSWILQKNYAQAQSIYKEEMDNYEEELKQSQPQVIKGQKEKDQVIKELLAKWEALEKKLLETGAKTFEELHPDLSPPEDVNNSRTGWPYNRSRVDQNKQQPFENKVSFRLPDLTETKRERYTELFEAVYAGDEEKVKDLCLGSNPLQIAVQDIADYNPFSLAVVRGHYDLARTVLDIAAAQYQPKEEEAKTYRYSITRPRDRYDHGDDNELAEDDDNDDMTFYRELVDEVHTIDDIRVLSENVKSRVSPSTLINQYCQLWRLIDADATTAKQIFRPSAPQRYFHVYNQEQHQPWDWFNEMYEREKARNNWSLVKLAILNNDLDLLKFLLTLRKDLRYRKDDKDGKTLKKLQPGKGDVEFALRLGHTELISEMIRCTGIMMPLASLAKKSGVDVGEKTEFYQGLSVYGKKREDWARQERGEQAENNDYDQTGSPLLAAIMSGNIETVEYFLSDTPLRCYEEFIKAFEHDSRIQSLAKAEGGIERALHTWLNTRTHLALHMAVMADQRISEPLLGYLIKRMPQYIDGRSSSKETPLHLAFRIGNYRAAKELIEAGADQTTRNRERENLLHTIYNTRDDHCDINSLRELAGMLKPELLPQLALQRTRGAGETARTPLMRFFSTCIVDFREGEKNVVDVMLEYSGGEDLEVMDGAGDYPLHALIRTHSRQSKLIEHFARQRPDLLFKENAVGITPVEISENAFFRKMLTRPPAIRMNKVQDITSRPAENFLNPNYSEAKGTVWEPKAMYDLLREIAAANPHPRGLVSIIDANETARRLAEQQQRQNADLKRREAQGLKSYSTSRRGAHYQRSDDGDGSTQGGDEVVWWEQRMREQRNIAPTPPREDWSLASGLLGGLGGGKSRQTQRRRKYAKDS